MERPTSAATCAEHRHSKSDARSSAADAATHGTAPTPEFRQVTRPSSDDVIINGKSFSAQGLSARKTGEANGFPNAANRVRPEGPFGRTVEPDATYAGDLLALERILSTRAVGMAESIALSH